MGLSMGLDEPGNGLDWCSPGVVPVSVECSPGAVSVDVWCGPGYQWKPLDWLGLVRMGTIMLKNKLE